MAESTSRPWHARTIALEPVEGAYADFVAWEQWMQADEERAAILEHLEEIDSLEPVFLYSDVCDIFDGRLDAEPDLVQESRP